MPRPPLLKPAAALAAAGLLLAAPLLAQPPLEPEGGEEIRAPGPAARPAPESRVPFTGEDVAALLRGDASSFAVLVITGLPDDAVDFTARIRGQDGPRLGTVPATELREVLEQLGRSPGLFVGRRLTTAAALTVPAAPDADVPPDSPAVPAVLPGLWTAADLERYLAGGMPWIEGAYVEDVPTYAETGGEGPFPHYADPDGTVFLILSNVDEVRAGADGTKTGVELPAREAQVVLGRFGLSLREGTTLKPRPEAAAPAPAEPATETAASLGGGFAARSAPSNLDRLAQKAADADGDAREVALSDLRNALADRFDAAQADREQDLAALEAKVKRLRELHDKRAAAKADIVARRAEALLRAAEGLGWEDPAGSAGGSGGRLNKEVPAGGGGFGGRRGGGFGGAGLGGKSPAAAGTAVGTVTKVDSATGTLGDVVPVLEVALNTSVFVSDGDRLAVVGGPGRAARDGRGLTLGTLTVIGGDNDRVRGSFRSEGGGPVRVGDRVVRRTDPPEDAPDDGGNRDEP